MHSWTVKFSRASLKPFRLLLTFCYFNTVWQTIFLNNFCLLLLNTIQKYQIIFCKCNFSIILVLLSNLCTSVLWYQHCFVFFFFLLFFPALWSSACSWFCCLVKRLVLSVFSVQDAWSLKFIAILSFCISDLLICNPSPAHFILVVQSVTAGLHH